MTTSKPISGVSYNTEPFLLGVLADLVRAGRISQYYLVHHEPDSDSKKAHWHLLMFPTGAVNPFALANQFDEVDPTNEKPLKFLPTPETQGRCLSIQDWLLYAIHDPDYLASKNLSRQIHYSRSAVKSYDEDELASRWASLPPVRLGRQALTAKAVKLVAEGKGWTEILLTLGDELSKDPYLVGFLREVCTAAYENATAASDLVKRLLPPDKPKEVGSSGTISPDDLPADIRRLSFGGYHFGLPDDLEGF